MGQPDLPGSGGRLIFLEPEAAAGEAKMATADRDRPGGDEDHLLAAAAAPCDVVGECRKPRTADLAGIGDQQRRADLDDEPTCRGERLRRGGVFTDRLSPPHPPRRSRAGSPRSPPRRVGEGLLSSLSARLRGERAEVRWVAHRSGHAVWARELAAASSLALAAASAASTASSASGTPAPVAPDTGRTGVPRPALRRSSPSFMRAALGSTASILLSPTISGFSARQ